MILTCFILLTSFYFPLRADNGPNPAYNYNRECRLSTPGSEYTGTTSVTTTGRICQAWASQAPHPHTYTDPRIFPDATLEDASNYCRNPAKNQGRGPWCYTTDADVSWEYCDIPLCSRFAECKLMQDGADYLGNLNTSISGKTCLPWTSVGIDLEENYCRNPTSEVDGPYCYTSQTEWEYCDVHYCKPSAYCLTDNAGDNYYVGSVAVTTNGRVCQRWDSQVPQAHPFTEDEFFPDGSVREANNFCRNPGGGEEGPWCYTMDAGVRWESCGIPQCKDCLISFEGQDYAGILSKASSGLGCLKWTELGSFAQQYQNSDRFPDANLDLASNYCRNPDRDPTGPWCFTSNVPNGRESCNIAHCNDQVSTSPFHKRLSRHVVHIGIDGLRPCFVNASSGAPNIVERVGKQGAYTLNMGRSVLTTVSAPNWLAATCAMSPESSGTTGNSWKSPWLGYPQDITPIFGDTMPFPCIWKEIKSQDRNIRTASFTDWDWWNYITSMGLPKSLDYDYYCNGLSSVCDDKDVNAAIDFLNQTLPGDQTTYTFFYFLTVDETGHKFGWCGTEYNKAVDIVDQQVGRILDIVDKYDRGETSVYINTDHGGHAKTHGSYVDTDIIIPMFMRGPGIKVNYEFQHEVRNTDITPTIMHMLGLRPNLWWDGKLIKEAFTDF